MKKLAEKQIVDLKMEYERPIAEIVVCWNKH